MPDEPVKPPQDNSDSDAGDTGGAGGPTGGAFNDFVNDHLDLSDLEANDSPADAKPTKPFQMTGRASPARSDDHDPWTVEDDDDEVFDGDDDHDASTPTPPRPSSPIGGLFGSRPPLGTSPFGGIPSSSRRTPPEPPRIPGSAPFGATSANNGDPSFGRPGSTPLTPPRMAAPPLNDPRWRKVSFYTAADLEIYHSGVLGVAVRVTVIPNARRVLGGKLKVIHPVASSWIPVKVELNGRPPIIGFVRSEAIVLNRNDYGVAALVKAVTEGELKPIPPSLALLVAMLITLIVLLFNTINADVAFNQQFEALLAQTAQQETRIQQLEAELFGGSPAAQPDAPR